MGHYEEVEKAIRAHYRRIGAEIEIEPHGSRGPDIKAYLESGSLIIGEIKSEKEIRRDLSGYWGQWNSSRSFGGKQSEYKLQNNYSDKGKSLATSGLKGWVSVIDGQLRGYCEKELAPYGDLVVERIEVFKGELFRAIEYLQSENRVSTFTIQVDRQGLGYVSINFI